MLTKASAIFSSSKRRVLQFVDKRPFTTFVGLLAALLILVIVGTQLRKPAPEAEKPAAEPKKVAIFSNGEKPAVTLTAKVEKAGVITVMAQSSGIVQKINVHEGSTVKQGATLASLSTNYQGGNAAAVSRQIAQRNLKFSQDTYDLQKGTISTQRSLAEKQNTQASDLRDITRQSHDDTANLITLNENLLADLDAQITKLENSNVIDPTTNIGNNDAQILGYKQAKNGAQATLNSLRAGQRSSDYTGADDKTPAEISNTMKDITLRQLDLQEKSLDLSKDLAGLQLKLARVTEALMYPATPCAGVVERVFVKIGQNVTPGTPIAVIRANTREVTAVVSVGGDLAQQISRTEPSTFTVNNTTFSIVPRYVSLEPTEGSLHAVIYSVPQKYEPYFADKDQVAVTVPVGVGRLQSVGEYIPLDAIYQTQDKSFVYIVRTGEDGNEYAQVKTVQLGNVSGEYVAVTAGLDPADTVITTRGVSDGDRVVTQ